MLCFGRLGSSWCDWRIYRCTHRVNPSPGPNPSRLLGAKSSASRDRIGQRATQQKTETQQRNEQEQGQKDITALANANILTYSIAIGPLPLLIFLFLVLHAFMPGAKGECGRHEEGKAERKWWDHAKASGHFSIKAMGFMTFHVRWQRNSSALALPISMTVMVLLASLGPLIDCGEALRFLFWNVESWVGPMVDWARPLFHCINSLGPGPTCCFSLCQDPLSREDVRRCAWKSPNHSSPNLLPIQITGTGYLVTNWASCFPWVSLWLTDRFLASSFRSPCIHVSFKASFERDDFFQYHSLLNPFATLGEVFSTSWSRCLSWEQTSRHRWRVSCSKGAEMEKAHRSDYGTMELLLKIRTAYSSYSIPLYCIHFWNTEKYTLLSDELHR